MKKQILTILPLSLVFLFSSCNNNTSDESSYIEYSYNASKKEASVTGINNINITNVVIPSTVTHDNVTYTVTKISTDAFKASSSTAAPLESIVMSDTITKVEDEAFYNCANLRYVKFSNSLTTLGASVFSGCSKLVNIELPTSLTTIGMRCFKNCTSLYSIYLPKNVSRLSGETFSGDTSLKYMYIQDLKTISNNDFYNCKSLKTIYFNQETLPQASGTNTYYDSATKYMSQDLNMDIDDAYYYVIDHESDTAMISGVKDLNTKDVVVKSSIEFMNHVYTVNGIYDYAFYNKSLNSISLSENCSTISKYAFYNSGLSSINLSNVKTIGEYGLAFNLFESVSFNEDATLAEGALSSCTNLKNCVLPVNSTYISKYLFKFDTLDYIVISSKVTLINISALENANIDTIYYTSSKEDFENITNNDKTNTAKSKIEYNYVIK